MWNLKIKYIFLNSTKIFNKILFLLDSNPESNTVIYSSYKSLFWSRNSGSGKLIWIKSNGNVKCISFDIKGIAES